jgi:hypothetical protein
MASIDCWTVGAFWLRKVADVLITSGTSKMALELELATYKEKLPELLAGGNEGKFVLVHDRSIIDVYGTYEDALKEGYNRFKLAPFLVKQVQSVEQIHFISRFLPCPTLHARSRPTAD